MKGKRIAGGGEWELRRSHGREYRSRSALVKGKLVKSKAKRAIIFVGEDFPCTFTVSPYAALTVLAVRF